MSLCLVLHDLGPVAPEAEQMFFAAVFEIAPDHWRVTEDATLVATEVSPGYLLDHLRRSAARARLEPRILLVTRVPAEVATHGLPENGEAWIREMLESVP